MMSVNESVDDLPSEVLDPSDPDYKKKVAARKKARKDALLMEECMEEARGELERECLLSDECSPEYQAKIRAKAREHWAEKKRHEKELAEQIEDCKNNSMFQFDPKKGYVVDQDLPVMRGGQEDDTPGFIQQALAES